MDRPRLAASAVAVVLLLVVAVAPAAAVQSVWKPVNGVFDMTCTIGSEEFNILASSGYNNGPSFVTDEAIGSEGTVIPVGTIVMIRQLGSGAVPGAEGTLLVARPGFEQSHRWDTHASCVYDNPWRAGEDLYWFFGTLVEPGRSS